MLPSGVRRRDRRIPWCVCGVCVVLSGGGDRGLVLEDGWMSWRMMLCMVETSSRWRNSPSGKKYIQPGTIHTCQLQRPYSHFNHAYSIPYHPPCNPLDHHFHPSQEHPPSSLQDEPAQRVSVTAPSELATPRDSDLSGFAQSSRIV